MRSSIYYNAAAKALTLFIVAISLLPFIQAAGNFQVSIDICAPEWHCTAYSQGSCGTRSCIDINVCGSNYEKPAEYLVCTPITPTGGGGGFTVPTTNTTDVISSQNGFFSLSQEMLNIELVKGQMITKKIVIKSYSDEEYSAKILYPKEYSQSQSLVSIHPDSFILRDGKDTELNIIFDALDVNEGTYYIPIEISNKKISKNVSISITVNSPGISQLDFQLKLINRLAVIGIDDKINVTVQIAKEDYDKYFGGNLNITYEIKDSQNVVIKTIVEPLITEDGTITKSIDLPEKKQEGYYMLTVAIGTYSQNFRKTAIFTLVPSDKYLPIIEMPRVISKRSLYDDLYTGIFVTFLVVVCIGLFMTYKRWEKLHPDFDEYGAPLRKNPRLLRKAVEQGFVSDKDIESLAHKKVSRRKSNNENIEKLQNTKKEYIYISPGRVEQIFSKDSGEDKAFRLVNGEKIHSLNELLAALEKMSPEIFGQHINHEENDFADWIRTVFDEKILAAEIHDASSQTDMIKILKDHKNLER